MVEHDNSLVGAGTAADRLKVQIKKMKANLLQAETGGMWVDGMNNIIPKMSEMSIFILVNEPVKVFPDGARIYREGFKMTNHHGIHQAGGVGMHVFFAPKLQHYFLDSSGNRIFTEVVADTTQRTADKISGMVEVSMSAPPAKAFSVVTNDPWPPEGGAPINFQVAIQLVLGFSPFQLGMGER